MKIEITKKECRTLLDIFHLADWILHCYKATEDQASEDFRSLEQKFLAFAKDMGFETLVEFDPVQNQYVFSRKYGETNTVVNAIVEYDNESFWEELRERLVMRDLVLKEGRAEVLAMADEERLDKTKDLREKFAAEFENHGISRLVVKE